MTSSRNWQDAFTLNWDIDDRPVSAVAMPCFRLCLYKYDHPDLDDAFLERHFNIMQSFIEPRADYFTIDSGSGGRPRKIPKDKNMYGRYRDRLKPGLNFTGIQVYDKVDVQTKGSGPNTLTFFVIECPENIPAGKVFISYTDLCIEVSRFEENPRIVHDLLPHLSDAKIACGLAGYGIAAENDIGGNFGYAQEIIKRTRRFPVVDVAPAVDRGYDHTTGQKRKSSGIVGINWLTFVGAPFLEKLGGANQLRKKLSEEVDLIDCGGFVVLQLGSEPISGDVNTSENLSLYYHVGEVLDLVKIPREKIGGLFNDRDFTEQWTHRFFPND